MTGVAEHALAIANLKARYCAAADYSASDPARARELFADVFVEDFVGDYGFDPLIGAQAIIDFLCSAIGGNSEWLIHMLHSPSIKVDGDKATGDWTVLVHLKRRATGAVDMLFGRYSDEFALTPQGWRIATVRFERLE